MAETNCFPPAVKLKAIQPQGVTSALRYQREEPHPLIHCIIVDFMHGVIGSINIIVIPLKIKNFSTCL